MRFSACRKRSCRGLVRCARAFLERSLEIFRLSMLTQKIAKGFACELVEALHLIAPEQIKREPGFLVKLHELAPDASALPCPNHLTPSGPPLRHILRVRQEAAMPQASAAYPARDHYREDRDGRSGDEIDEIVAAVNRSRGQPPH